MLDDILKTKSEKIRMKNAAKVQETIRQMIADGKDKLQIVADFDRTLSKWQDKNGKPLASCYDALDRSPLLPDDYRAQATNVRDHYMAIETDPHMSIEEKYPFMVEWWTKAHDLLVNNCDLTRSKLTQIVSQANIALRDGWEWFFKSLEEACVPLLIFSAGVGDVIQELLTQRYSISPNMKVVSNFMKFDEQERLVGFQGDIIHVFNKNESAIHKSDYFANLSHRCNIILMGDSLGDLRMADGATSSKNVLKVGFLNHRVDEFLPKYLDAFDVVLLEDESLDVVNEIVEHILNSTA